MHHAATLGESFSILKRIVVGETAMRRRAAHSATQHAVAPFSILKRIVVGETEEIARFTIAEWAFSILKRIVVGETVRPSIVFFGDWSFSILKRIVVGETWLRKGYDAIDFLSVSSNGSWWVKLAGVHGDYAGPGAFSILKRIVVGETRTEHGATVGAGVFQYPQTDRGG